MKLTNLHNFPQYPLDSQYSILSLFRRYWGMEPTSELLGWTLVVGIIGLTVLGTWRPYPLVATTQSRPLLLMALSLVAAACLNPHLHHYDLMLASIAAIVAIVALSEWSVLSSV